MSNHRIRIEYAVDQPHMRGNANVTVECAGEGDLDHWLQTLRAALVAAGFGLETAVGLHVDGAVDAGLVGDMTPESPAEQIAKLRAGLDCFRPREIVGKGLQG